MNSKSGKDGAPVTFSSTVKKVLESAYLKPFCFWLIWMLVGTVFYAYELNTGWAKGFYMAVNVGYSIGWGFPAEDSNGTRVFSTFYVLVGASAVAASLGYFAQSMVDSSQEWYAHALVAENYKNTTSLDRVAAWLQMNVLPLQRIFLTFALIGLLMVYSLIAIGWGWSDALYFAVSSLSTGGLWRIPDDSSQWQFGFVGIIAAVGVPLMGLAMANIAAMVITIGDPDEAEKTIAAKVTLEELQMMQRFNLDDGDGQINRAEYILLCCVRLGALSPDLIGKINERFILLDTSGDGMLSHSEILEYPPEQHTTGNVMHDQDPETGAAAVSNSTNNTCVYSDIPNGNSSPRGNGELDPMMQHKNPVFQPRSPNGENSSGSSSSNVAAMVKSVQMQAITRSSSGPDALTPTVADTTTSNSRKSDMY
mmetsp:Transcript_12559/g.21013  ORF Transcript_12559/g.21013 Transcript_12559/m.21013 type:complete len:422 (-) Transcript_12559:389-1654(-)